MKIAIIGAGISGLGLAYLLHKDHDITLYEKNNYLGGHSRTVDIKTTSNDKAKTISVDSGFIVFNDRNYPNLMGLFNHLGVKYEKSDMSFGVSINKGWLEYGSKGLLAQKFNLMRPQFLKMLLDILKFNHQAPKFLKENKQITLGEYLDELGMGSWFRQYYLLAMGAAIWSCPIDQIMKFPARTFIQFFENHGLLTINGHPQWLTVTGGSREYVKLLSASFQNKIKLNSQIKEVNISGNKPIITEASNIKTGYDRVIFACHADEALALLNHHADYQPIIGQFDFQPNHIIIHKDKGFMPLKRKSWASWVYLSEGKRGQNSSVSLSYWMNNLQNLDCDEPILITLNPHRRPKESLILDEHHFTHPIFDEKAILAQEKIDEIQGHKDIYFCGAYGRYGFHEDGLLSAVKIAKRMGVSIPWH